MNPIWLLRMRRWVARPPSALQVRIVLVVVALCALLVVIERLGYWPEALSVERLPRGIGHGR
ncbi:hypothetical protein [Litorisediminicola beolgyonensis]|uniref:Uncharacterized protein n=1 Tax=Litorisediminicola beolgyonensis TaxID=1173614 RepID=A0ABW3ZJV8_9RHOB